VRHHARADGRALVCTSFSNDPLKVPTLMLLTEAHPAATELSSRAGDPDCATQSRPQPGVDSARGLVMASAGVRAAHGP
jgi:hypothetical protein